MFFTLWSELFWPRRNQNRKPKPYPHDEKIKYGTTVEVKYWFYEWMKWKVIKQHYTNMSSSRVVNSFYTYLVLLDCWEVEIREEKLRVIKY